MAQDIIHFTLKREIKKSIPFKITSKRIIYLGVNILEEVKDLYNENYKTLKKEIEGDKINGKIFHFHRL